MCERVADLSFENTERLATKCFEIEAGLDVAERVAKIDFVSADIFSSYLGTDSMCLGIQENSTEAVASIAPNTPFECSSRAKVSGTFPNEPRPSRSWSVNDY